MDWKVVKCESKDIVGEVSKTHHAIQTLDKTISNLEMELVVARAAQESILSGPPLSEDSKKTDSSLIENILWLLELILLLAAGKEEIQFGLHGCYKVKKERSWRKRRVSLFALSLVIDWQWMEYSSGSIKGLHFEFLDIFCHRFLL
ncbi:unnamed protein product [Camellia sinensis]